MDGFLFNDDIGHRGLGGGWLKCRSPCDELCLQKLAARSGRCGSERGAFRCCRTEDRKKGKRKYSTYLLCSVDGRGCAFRWNCDDLFYRLKFLLRNLVRYCGLGGWWLESRGNCVFLGLAGVRNCSGEGLYIWESLRGMTSWHFQNVAKYTFKLEYSRNHASFITSALEEVKFYAPGSIWDKPLPRNSEPLSFETCVKCSKSC